MYKELHVTLSFYSKSKFRCWYCCVMNPKWLQLDVGVYNFPTDQSNVKLIDMVHSKIPAGQAHAKCLQSNFEMV